MAADFAASVRACASALTARLRLTVITTAEAASKTNSADTKATPAVCRLTNFVMR